MDEITLNFKNLMYQICKKWRVLLIAMLVGAVLADMAAVGMNIRRVSAIKVQLQASDEEQKDDTIDTDALRAVLSERESKEVEKAAASYMAYIKISDAQLAYYSDSILMQLDPNKVPTLTLQYYIDNGYKTEYPVVDSVDNAKDIGIALGNFASSGEVCEKIAKTLSWDSDITYVQELISYENEEHSLIVKIVAPEKADCEAMGNIVKQEISQCVSKLQEVYGIFEAKLAAAELVVAASQELMTAQFSQLSNIYSSKSDFRTSIASFSEAQKKYYEALIENSMRSVEGESFEILANHEDNDNEEIAQPDITIKYIHLKYIIVGLFAGLLISAFLILVQYIGSGMLMMPNDVQDAFGIPIISSIYSVEEKNRNMIDCLVERIFRGKKIQLTMEEQLSMSATAIRIAAEKGGMNRLWISSVADDQGTVQIKERLTNLLKMQGTMVFSGPSIVYDSESLEKMSECDGIVLVEGLGYSLYRDILKEKQLGEGSHVVIVGAVVVE